MRTTLARRRTLIAILVASALALAAGGTAWAFWAVTTTAGSSGASAATTVNPGATPTVNVAGTTVTVNWPAATLATGQAVTGYQVHRYDAATLTPQTMLTSCDGTVTATSCVETAVPQGSWKYTVVPRFATNWAGTESEMSTTALVDITGPIGGFVGAAGLTGTGALYSTSPTLSITFSPGTDSSGIATTGAVLTRAVATLSSANGTTDGVCGTFGTYMSIVDGTDPTSPKSDSVTAPACYRYQYTVSDMAGNPTTYTSGDIKVDTTAPTTPQLTVSTFSNTYWTPGSAVFYRSAATSGTFTVTGTSTDPDSGILGYSYPALGANWTAASAAPGSMTYTWAGSPAAPGTVGVTATNNAGLASANSPFTLTADDAAPTAGTVSYTAGSTGGSPVSVAFTTGTDAGSGLGTRLLQRSTAPLVALTCGTYSAFTTIVGGTNPVSPVADTVPTGSCNRYQYVVSDHVGNAHTASSANVAHTPYGAHWTFDAGTGTTALDTFGNNNTGTLGATAGWTTGRIGAYALNLNGTAASVVNVPGPVIDTSQSYTVAAWVKLNTLTGFQTFASLSGTNVSPFYLQLNAGQFNFGQRGSDSTASTLSEAKGLTPTTGTWYHVAGVYDKTANTVSLYVNGVLQSTSPATTAWKATNQTVIGHGKWNGAPVDYVNGSIDDVRFYDRVLTAAELATIGTAP